LLELDAQIGRALRVLYEQPYRSDSGTYSTFNMLSRSWAFTIFARDPAAPRR
jgi:hypothetical protein